MRFPLRVPLWLSKQPNSILKSMSCQKRKVEAKALGLVSNKGCVLFPDRESRWVPCSWAGSAFLCPRAGAGFSDVPKSLPALEHTLLLQQLVCVLGSVTPPPSHPSSVSPHMPSPQESLSLTHHPACGSSWQCAHSEFHAPDQMAHEEPMAPHSTVSLMAGFLDLEAKSRPDGEEGV